MVPSAPALSTKDSAHSLSSEQSDTMGDVCASKTERGSSASVFESDSVATSSTVALSAIVDVADLSAAVIAAVAVADAVVTHHKKSLPASSAVNTFHPPAEFPQETAVIAVIRCSGAPCHTTAAISPSSIAAIAIEQERLSNPEDAGILQCCRSSYPEPGIPIRQ